jgi:hypothetical protein
VFVIERLVQLAENAIEGVNVWRAEHLAHAVRHVKRRGPRLPDVELGVHHAYRHSSFVLSIVRALSRGTAQSVRVRRRVVD